MDALNVNVRARVFIRANPVLVYARSHVRLERHAESIRAECPVKCACCSKEDTNTPRNKDTRGVKTYKHKDRGDYCAESARARAHCSARDSGLVIGAFRFVSLPVVLLSSKECGR